jgi:hypothetical protein
MEANTRILEILRKRFETQEASIRSAIEARSRARLEYLENTIARRKESEKKDILNVLDQLEKTIQKELTEEQKAKQLALPGFDERERDQIRRDLVALEARLERIPEERARESKAIEKRYADLTDRTFPVAVAFLVPGSQIRGV